MNLRLLAIAVATSFCGCERTHVETTAAAAPPAPQAQPTLATAPLHKCRAPDALSTQKGCVALSGVTALK